MTRITPEASEYFKRQCWISFEPVEGSLSALADYIGPEKILWATDYPHPDGFSRAHRTHRKRRSCRRRTKRKIRLRARSSSIVTRVAQVLARPGCCGRAQRPPVGVTAHAQQVSCKKPI